MLTTEGLANSQERLIDFCRSRMETMYKQYIDRISSLLEEQATLIHQLSVRWRPRWRSRRAWLGRRR